MPERGESMDRGQVLEILLNQLMEEMEEADLHLPRSKARKILANKLEKKLKIYMGFMILMKKKTNQ